MAHALIPTLAALLLRRDRVVASRNRVKAVAQHGVFIGAEIANPTGVICRWRREYVVTSRGRAAHIGDHKVVPASLPGRERIINDASARGSRRRATRPA